MGLNTENLFVRCESADAVAQVVEEHLKLPAANRTPLSHWPLEDTFQEPERNRGRKVSISEPREGWVAVVEDRECVEPALALALSDKLRTVVVVIQVYEVTSSFGLAVSEHGRIASSVPTHHDTADPFGEAVAALRDRGIGFSPIQFRETVGRQAAGWRTVSHRAG